MRHITYAARLASEGYMEVAILEQTHVGYEFSDGTRGNIFAYKGFILKSDMVPACYSDIPSKVFVRGTAKNQDYPIKLRLPAYERFKAAVEAYNEKYAK